jgi:simple sugar transport system substrate-binding protein
MKRMDRNTTLSGTALVHSARRGLYFAVAGGLAAVAMACSGGGRPAEPTQPPAAAAQAKAPAPAGVSTPRYKFAMVTHAPAGDTFWDTIRKGAQTAADKDNVEFLYTSDGSAPKQAQLIEAAINQKVDGLIVTLAAPDAMEAEVRKAIAAGIPVVTINAGEDFSAKYGAIGHFGQNEDIAGQAAGEQMNTMGLKKVTCVIQAQGQVQLEARCAGAQKTFKGSMDKLYVEGTSMPDVRSKITASLQTDKTIDGVLTLGAPIALTAVQSVKDSASPARVVTFDMNPELVAALKAGDVQFAIDQQPYLQGYLGVDSLWLYKTNGNVLGGGRPVLTGPAIVTKDTVAQIEEYASRGTR